MTTHLRSFPGVLATWVVLVYSAQGGEAARIAEFRASVSPELGRYKELQGNIEYFACSEGGKAYESLLVLRDEPNAVQAVLTEMGLVPGSPASVNESGDLIPPHGPGVTLVVEWQDEAGVFTRVRAEELILDTGTNRPMPRVEWTFTGSRVLEDPETGRWTLEAQMTRNLVSTHLADRSVLLQNPLAEAVDQSRYKPNHALLPADGTALTLIMDATDPVAFRIHASADALIDGIEAFIFDAATSLGVRGYVRKRSNGSVKALLEGRVTVVDELLRRVRSRIGAAREQGLDIRQVPAEGASEEFRILDTRVAP